MSHATSAPGWPVLRGIQTVKEVAYLNMREAAAAAALAKLWSDTFLTNAGIYAGGSSGYTYRGATDYDVILLGYGSNILSGGTPTDDDTHPAPASYGPAIAVDGNTATRWSTAGTTACPHWWKYDFGAGATKTITKWRIYAQAGGMGTFKIQASNDNTNWTDLYHETNASWAPSDAWYDFTFINTTAYRYYRIYIIDSPSGNYVSAWEFQAMEGGSSLASIVSVRALDLAADVTAVMMFADVTLGTGTAAYYVSTDDGSTWTAVTPDTLATVPAGKQIRLKVELTGNAELESWGVAA